MRRGRVCELFPNGQLSMKKSFTSAQVVDRLWEYIGRGCNQTQLAKRIGVSVPFVNDILHGKREPSGKVLEFLGLERIVIYRFVPTSGKEVKP